MYLVTCNTCGTYFGAGLLFCSWNLPVGLLAEAVFNNDTFFKLEDFNFDVFLC
jgi:hypothetical protein